MIKSKKYHVMRFMEFNNQVEKILDYREGELLYDYINRADISKKDVCGLIRGLTTELNNYRSASENRPYEGVNPYNVLVTEKGEVLLLDMREKSNEFVNKKMESNAMRENYSKAYKKICIETGIPKDIFTFAVTIGYIMVSIGEKVKFTYLEQKRLMRVIERCIGEKRRIYTDFYKIEEDLKSTVNIPYKRVQKKTTAALTMMVLLLVILSFVLAFF